MCRCRNRCPEFPLYHDDPLGLGLTVVHLTSGFPAVLPRYVGRQNAEIGQVIGDFEVIPALIVKFEDLPDNSSFLRHNGKILHFVNNIAARIGTNPFAVRLPAAHTERTFLLVSVTGNFVD